MTPSPPPIHAAPTFRTRLQRHLFHPWYNTLLTLGALGAIAWGVTTFFTWATTVAQWTVISTNLKLFLAGRFPDESLWRLWVVAGIMTGLGGLTLGSYGIGQRLPTGITRALPVAWVVLFPVIFWLITGGFGLQAVQTTNLSGLLLTLFTAVISMVLAFPLGVLLALGRQSPLPVVRLCSTIYIEVLRGLPLIGVLFIALVMLPLVLPPHWGQPDPLWCGLAGLTLFGSAYMAEVVRGGLQSVPEEQLEAARALGLNPLLVIGFILLPQALRAVIPALVGECISLFKETTLLSVFGLIELLGISASILANPEFVGRYPEVYLFVGAIYWLLCYALSTASKYLETR